MSLVQSIILGVVEGVTEFLPISSTGHLILVSRLLNIPATEFLKSFEISIQLGAILAVVFLYAKTFLIDRAVLKKIFVAFIPTGVIGLVFYKFVKHYLLASAETVLWALFSGGIVLIVFELFYRKKAGAVEKIADISYKQSIIIGLFQSIAIIPGVSRAAATIVGGLALGLNRKTIVEFSFLLAVPTMLAASGWDFIQNTAGFSASQAGLFLAGFFSSFAVAFLAMKFLLNYIQRHSFVVFGVYRVLLALLFWSLTLG